MGALNFHSAYFLELRPIRTLLKIFCFEGDILTPRTRRGDSLCAGTVLECLLSVNLILQSGPNATQEAALGRKSSPWLSIWGTVMARMGDGWSGLPHWPTSPVRFHLLIVPQSSKNSVSQLETQVFKPTSLFEAFPIQTTVSGILGLVRAELGFRIGAPVPVSSESRGASFCSFCVAVRGNPGIITFLIPESIQDTQWFTSLLITFSNLWLLSACCFKKNLHGGLGMDG